MQVSKFAALSLIAAAAASAHGVHVIDNSAYANTNFNVGGTSTEQHIADAFQWQDANFISTVTASSNFHMWDPPQNVSTAMSDYRQPTFGDASVRAKSFCNTSYSGVGNPAGFQSSSRLHIKQTLQVDVGAWPGFVINLKLEIPMHGFLAARGYDANRGYASASLEATGSRDGNIVGSYATGVTVVGTGFDTYTYTPVGGWSNDLTEISNVMLPVPFQPSQVPGLELNSHDLIDLGPIPTNQLTIFTIEYTLETSSIVDGSSGQHAMVDFSGTGSVTFTATDAFGQPFTNFTVNPAPASNSIAGHVTLQDLSTGPSGHTIQYEIRGSGGSVVSSGSADLNASGNYSIPAGSVPNGSYTLWVKSDTFLARAVAVTLNGPVTGVNFSLKNGDVDGDNEVALGDFGVLSGSFGSFLGDPGFAAGADLDKDGEVGLADFGILSANFGELGD